MILEQWLNLHTSAIQNVRAVVSLKEKNQGRRPCRLFKAQESQRHVSDHATISSRVLKFGPCVQSHVTGTRAFSRTTVPSGERSTAAWAEAQRVGGFWSSWETWAPAGFSRCSLASWGRPPSSPEPQGCCPQGCQTWKCDPVMKCVIGLYL